MSGPITAHLVTLLVVAIARALLVVLGLALLLVLGLVGRGARLLIAGLTLLLVLSPAAVLRVLTNERLVYCNNQEKSENLCTFLHLSLGPHWIFSSRQA